MMQAYTVVDVEHVPVIYLPNVLLTADDQCQNYEKIVEQLGVSCCFLNIAIVPHCYVSI